MVVTMLNMPRGTDSSESIRDEAGMHGNRSQGPVPDKAAPTEAAEWACPKCRAGYAAADAPAEYRCMCGAEVDPPFDPWLLPHTCGHTCGRALAPDCGHTCVLLCHPGPCPPCPRQVRRAPRSLCPSSHSAHGWKKTFP